MKKLNFILSLVFILALAACNKTGGSVPSPSSLESSNQALAYNELTFEVLENDQGLPENMTESIGSIRVYEGFAYFKAEDEYVVFIGMGKKPTGGYGIEVKTVEDIEGLTKITVEEKSPQNGDVVTQALTYPYVLVKIKGCAENFEVATVTQEKLPLIEIKTDSGRYQGLADNNFIEIKISGVPDEKGSRVFQLSEELKENFEQLKLKKDDDIKFRYMENAGANPVIIEIQPLAIQTMEVAVYYLKSNENEVYLVREVHQVEKSERVALAALNELIQGVPVTPGAYRVLPAETEILGISIDRGLATVDFSGDVLKANVGATGEALGISSIVNTLTEFPTIQRVRFIVDGQADKGMDWWGHVGLYDQPFERNLSLVYEPVIWVTAPAIGQAITSPVKITGNARIFEAVVNFRLKDADGNILAEGYAQASAGAPDRGDFTSELAFPVEAAGKGQLEVFEVSMKDGSDQNLVVIPVELR